MRDVGLAREGAGLSARIEEAAREIRTRLAAVADVVSPPVAASGSEAAAAAAAVKAAECACALVVPLVWCEDQVMRAAIRGLGSLPILLGTFLPQPRLGEHVDFEEMLAGSGVVGSLQAGGMLARDNVRVVSLAGWRGDEKLYATVGMEARAAAAARGLRGARLGLLPGRCEEMSVTWVDEGDLRRRYGVRVVPIGIARLSDAARQSSSDAVTSLRARLAAMGFVVETDAASLEQGLRAALGIGRIADEERLAGIAMNDIAPSMHAALGLRPCLSDPSLCETGLVIAMEADVAACLAMAGLRRLTRSAPFYSEVLNAGVADDCLLLGHAGWHDPAVRDPGWPAAIIPDEEYRHSNALAGAALCFKVASGPVTAVNAVWRAGRLLWTAIEGESLEGPPRLSGSCHLVMRTDAPVSALINGLIARGTSQHWIVVPGRRAVEVEAFARWMESDAPEEGQFVFVGAAAG
jgi:L-fucose isomerase-like protein